MRRDSNATRQQPLISSSRSRPGLLLLLLGGMLLAPLPAIAQGNYMGLYTANPYATNRLTTPQPGLMDNSYASGSTSPKLYDDSGNFRGNLNTNQYDPNKVSNPYGRYCS